MKLTRFPSVLVWASLLFTARLAGAGTPVTLGVVTWIGYGPIYCAAANGYYKKYGLDVRLVNFSDNSVMAGAAAERRNRCDHADVRSSDRLQCQRLEAQGRHAGRLFGGRRCDSRRHARFAASRI